MKSFFKLKIDRYMRAVKLAQKAFGAYKKQIMVLLGLGFLGGILEGVGINAVIPLFSFLDGTYLLSDDIVTRTTRGLFQFLHIPFTLKFLLIFIASLFIFKAIAIFYSKYITEKIHATYIRDTQMKLLSKTLDASWPYLSKHKIGYLEKVLTNDISVGASLLSQISGIMILFVNIVIYGAIAFNLAPNATLVALASGAVLFFVFKPIAYKIRVIATRRGDVLKISANHTNESMTGIKTIKAMALENKIIQKAGAIFDESKNIAVKLAYLSNFANVAIQPASVVVVLGLFAYTYKTGDFTFASFAVIIYAINKIFAYVQQAQIQLQNVNANYPFLKTVVEYEERALSYEESKEGREKFSFKDTLSIKNVSFSYNKHGKTLHEVNLDIKKGEMVGVIGPSGSGKTTFVDLLLRLIDPTSGEILLDGKDVKNIKMREWRDNIGYVAQDNFLINDTIRNNIKFYSEEISDDDMIKSAKLANIYDFIMNLPDGFESVVGERGTSLSGGQRQRIVLARVLARKPEILILDEATSALDNESQALVQDAIEHLHGEITVIIIAHRPSTVMNVDELVVIDNGKIAERGNPGKMLADKNSYFHKIIYEY